MCIMCLYNTDIHITCVYHISICTIYICIIQLYMIHVTYMYKMCLYNTDIHWSENRIHQTLPSVISPCSHITTKLLVFWVWVPTIQNALCLYYMLEMKGNMYQCGGYFMPLFCIAFIQLHIVDTTTTWPHSDQNTDTCHFFSKVFQSTTSFYLILWNLMLGPNICSTQLSCLPLNASYMDFCNSIQHLGSGPFF